MSLRISIPVGLLLSRVFAASEPTAEQLEFFEARIRPALADHCFRCHSEDAEKLKGDLRLDSFAGLLRGGDLGPSLSIESPESSLFLEAVRWKSRDLQMPPKAPVPAAVLADFEKWILMGAPWPGSSKSSSDLKSQEGGYDFDAARKHWAFQAVGKPELPPAAKGREIDWFVQRKLAEHKLEPSPEAPKHTLIRRAYFAMIGLPPTPEQTAEFVEGRIRWDEIIEQLLASPHYGARWGRHWLDVARFADGYGGFLDGGRFDEAWRYRDWVVNSLNEDMPYNRFLELQLAGDILEPEKHAIATGFIALGPQYRGDGGDAQSNAIAKIETLDDRVDTVGRGLLGLTLACARCHDHKFDPIPTMDYYSIAGIFQNTGVMEFPLVPKSEVDAWNAEIRSIADYRKETDQKLKVRGDELVEGELSRLPDYALAALEFQKLDPKPNNLRDWARQEGLVGTIFQYSQPFFAGPENTSKIPQADAWFTNRTAESLSELQKFLIDNPGEQTRKDFMNRTFRWDRNQVLEDLDEEFGKKIKARHEEHKNLEKNKPPKYPFGHALRETGKGNMKVAIRGNLLKPGEEAPRRFLRILNDDQPKFTEGSGRRELAAAVIDPANPLTARVFVNRVWGWHFGQGIVRTPSNFGLTGESPTHPQLLDWLTAKFVEDGWSVKELHRRILKSKTWRQSSRFDEASFLVDGDNRFLWRMNPQKQTAEVWRDSVLFVSKELDFKLGGRPFDNPDTDFRRTIHARASRNGDQFKTDSFLRLFDFPVPRASVAKRTPTITPQQSLFLLNNEFVRKRAEALASLMAKENNPVVFAYRTLFSRDPDSSELEVGQRFLAGDPESLKRYAQALIASNEFLFVE